MAIPIETAESYRRAGLSVLPAVRAQKRPALGQWRTWQKRFPTEIEVETWFSNDPDGVCIVAGAVSGNLECIDFDCGGEAYPAWSAKIGAELLASLVVERTPSGGYHVLYRSEGAVAGNQKLAQGVRNGKTATIVETRGEGGLFLCTPTPGYELLQGDFTRIPSITAEARESLLKAARELDEQPAAETPPRAQTGVSGAYVTRPGDDFARRGDPRPILAKHGWTPAGRNPDGNELWTRPGKDPRAGHSATLKDGIFYPFSSNAAPFEPNKGYNAYQVFALLEHGNDFKAAASALLDMGYGAKDECPGVDISAIFSDSSGDGSTLSGDDGGEEDCTPRETVENPGAIPEELFEVPGFVSELMGYTLRTAPYPNKALAFAGAFCLLAHLAGRKFTDESGTRPNVYILSLASSGTGKQHPRGVNVSLAAMNGFASEMGDYFASGEGLEDSFLSSPSMFFQIDEADTLFNTLKLGSDSKTEMINSMLLRLYSESSSVHIMRKKAIQRGQPASSSHIVQPHLTFLGTAVPKFFYQSLSERTMANGLLARCLVLEAGKRGTANENMSSEDFPERVATDIKTFLEIGRDVIFTEFPRPAVVPMEAAAKVLLREIRAEADAKYEKYEESGNESALALWARASEKVQKFALIRALSENVHVPVITADALLWARNFVFLATERMLYQSGLYVYESDFDRQMKKIMQKVMVKGKGRLPYRGILRSTGMAKDELKRVLETLVARGDLVVEHGRCGGEIFVMRGLKAE